MEIEKKADTSIRSDGAEIYIQGYIMLELGYPTDKSFENQMSKENYDKLDYGFKYNELPSAVVTISANTQTKKQRKGRTISLEDLDLL